MQVGSDYFETQLAFKKAIDRARKGKGPAVIISHVDRLKPHSSSDDHLKYRTKNEIDEMNSNLSALKSFILPGGSMESAYLHLARTSARKAERLIISLSQKEKINPVSIKYINRLSDHLFVSARFVNNQNQKEDILWIPGKSRK